MYALGISTVTKIVACPLDRIRILRQAEGQYLLTNRISRRLTNVEWAKEVINQEGYLSLFKGCLLEIIRGIPFQGITKYVKTTLGNLDIFKIRPRKDSSTKKQIKTHLVGFLSTSIAFFVVAPLDTIITRTVASIPSALNPVTTLSEAKDLIASPANFLSCFNGIIPSIISANIHRILYSMACDYLKKKIGTKTIDAAYAPSLSNAILVGLIQMTYPIDTIRRRAMINSELDFTGVKAVRSIWRQDGLLGFFVGVDICLVRSIVTIGVFELAKYINAKWNEKEKDE